MTTERRLVRSAEAARELGIDPSTLARWARQGIVTPARETIGGERRWDLAELRRQVDERIAEQGADDD